MPAKLRVLRAAAEDARAAWRWYRKRNVQVAALFLTDYDEALKRIAEAPDRWPPHVLGTRRFVFPRFPFVIVYRVKPRTIQIIAIAHQRRNPNYWRGR